MSQFLQYMLVILVLLGAIGLFIGVSLIKPKNNKGKEDCQDEAMGCSTCTDACGLKREIVEKSKAKRLRQSK